jgi:hypothetical protein
MDLFDANAAATNAAAGILDGNRTAVGIIDSAVLCSTEPSSAQALKKLPV